MVIVQKEKFKPKLLEEERKREIIPLSINPKEREQLEKDKKLLQQRKDGTAIKQLWSIGSKVLHSDSTGEILKIIIDNKRKNQRTGDDVYFE